MAIPSSKKHYYKGADNHSFCDRLWEKFADGRRMNPFESKVQFMRDVCIVGCAKADIG